MIGIYKITNLVNNKVYVGQAIDLEKRLSEHRFSLLGNRHINKHLQNAWNKYGEENFKFEVIEVCSEDKLTEREQYWIDYYGGMNSNNNYNQREASSKGHLSEESKQKMSISQLGHLVKAETRQKMRNRMLGNNYGSKVMQEKWKSEEWRNKIIELHKNNTYMKGKHQTEEAKRKIGEASRNHKHTNEAKQKISQTHKGIPKSYEHKQKIAKARLGTKWINNGQIAKMVHNEELDFYLANGYVLGRLNKKQ